MAYGHIIVEKLDNYGYKCLVFNLAQLDYLISCGAQPSQLMMPGEPVTECEQVLAYG